MDLNKEADSVDLTDLIINEIYVLVQIFFPLVKIGTKTAGSMCFFRKKGIRWLDN